jgi:tetratricopeptide (TPR) repeat protein
MAAVALTVAGLANLSCQKSFAGDDPFGASDGSRAILKSPKKNDLNNETDRSGRAVSQKTVEPLPPGDPLQVGFDLLKKLDYDRALAAFNLAARAEPANAEPHFGRAKALLGLQRRDEALKEFKLCTLLDPSANNTEKCNKEIEYYTAKAPAGAPLTVTTEDIEKSSTRVTNQASSRINQIYSDAYARGVYINRSLSRSSRYHHIPIPSVPSSSLSLNGGGGGMSARDYYIKHGTLSGYDSRAYERSRRYDASAKADDARRRAEAVKDAAVGLNHAMSTKPSDSSGIYLSPHGTNLYVRNYVNFDPAKPEPGPAEALSAKQMSIDTTLGGSQPPTLEELVNRERSKASRKSSSNK